MENKTTSSILLTLLLIGMLSLAFNIQPVEAESATIIVPDDYATIQEAINVATSGDTIYVHSGTYYENVVVNKTVSLVGENKVTTTIDGSGIGPVIEINANNVNISDFTVQNSSSRYPASGILIKNVSGCNIFSNIIKNNLHGIRLLYSSGNIMSNNFIMDSSDWGFDLHYSNNNTLSNNIIDSDWVGIELEYSNNNTLSDNTITHSYTGIILGVSSENTLSNNIVNNTSSLGIGLFEQSSYNIFWSNTIHGGWIGARIDQSTGNLFFHNNITGARYGIFFHNNFVDNMHQIRTVSGGYSFGNDWDNGYPFGGNYWSDHVTVDYYSGINQDRFGSDGIVDEPYIIDEGNQDSYPLVEPRGLNPSTPREALVELIETLETEDLPKGIEKSLTTKLEGAIHLRDIGNENGSMHKLLGFINQVEAQRGKKLTYDQADYLTTEAQRIIDLIEG